MKMRNLVMAGSIGLLAAGVQAKELTFHFDVFSSGPSIYACNAGIAHPAPQGGYCFLAGQPKIDENKCSPANPGGSLGDHDCVCVTPPGDTLLDFARVQHRPWQDGAWGNATKTVLTSGSGSFRSLIPLQGSAFNVLQNKLDSVTFELGSERYGAKYFVDICFRGPQIDYFSNDPDWVVNSPNGFAYTADFNVTDIDSSTSDDSYLDLAKPMFRSKIVCDTQGNGQYQFAHNGSNDYWDASFNGEYDQFDNEINYGDFNSFTSDFSEASTGAQNDFSNINSPWVQAFAQDWIAHFPNAPRFCVVRYEFMEGSVNERRWQRHDAHFVTKTKIWEPGE